MTSVYHDKQRLTCHGFASERLFLKNHFIREWSHKYFIVSYEGPHNCFDLKIFLFLCWWTDISDKQEGLAPKGSFMFHTWHRATSVFQTRHQISRGTQVSLCMLSRKNSRSSSHSPHNMRAECAVIGSSWNNALSTFRPPFKEVGIVFPSKLSKTRFEPTDKAFATWTRLQPVLLRVTGIYSGFHV